MQRTCNSGALWVVMALADVPPGAISPNSATWLPLAIIHTSVAALVIELYTRAVWVPQASPV